MAQQFANNARSELAADVAVGDTTITVADGSAFPVATAGAGALESGDWFKLVLDAGDSNEIVYVGTHAQGSNVFSDVRRSQEETTPKAFSATAVPAVVVGLRITSTDAAGWRDKVSEASAVEVATFTDPQQARPPAAKVVWRGPVAPVNAVNGDEWEE